jgi:hypothetical protein
MNIETELKELEQRLVELKRIQAKQSAGDPVKFKYCGVYTVDGNNYDPEISDKWRIYVYNPLDGGFSGGKWVGQIDGKDTAIYLTKGINAMLEWLFNVVLGAPGDCEEVPKQEI